MNLIDPQAVIFDAPQLKAMHDQLTELYRLVDDEGYVPERYDNGLKGQLANMDAEVLMLAANICHRMWLWARHPGVHTDDSYVSGYPEHSVKA